MRRRPNDCEPARRRCLRCSPKALLRARVPATHFVRLARRPRRPRPCARCRLLGPPPPPLAASSLRPRCRARRRSRTPPDPPTRSRAGCPREPSRARRPRVPTPSRSRGDVASAAAAMPYARTTRTPPQLSPLAARPRSARPPRCLPTLSTHRYLQPRMRARAMPPSASIALPTSQPPPPLAASTKFAHAVGLAPPPTLAASARASRGARPAKTASSSDARPSPEPPTSARARPPPSRNRARPLPCAPTALPAPAPALAIARHRPASARCASPIAYMPSRRSSPPSVTDPHALAIALPALPPPTRSSRRARLALRVTRLAVTRRRLTHRRAPAHAALATPPAALAYPRSRSRSRPPRRRFCRRHALRAARTDVASCAVDSALAQVLGRARRRPAAVPLPPAVRLLPRPCHLSGQVPARLPSRRARDRAPRPAAAHSKLPTRSPRPAPNPLGCTHLDEPSRMRYRRTAQRGLGQMPSKRARARAWALARALNGRLPVAPSAGRLLERGRQHGRLPGPFMRGLRLGGISHPVARAVERCRSFARARRRVRAGGLELRARESGHGESETRGASGI
ncbi:hypothetical protein B0H15DRAFT_154220 [Mycena belliarum]|uniref:Uncharacterized protein n=1 Tax=Mycena belliarum TaxID=1033014 RepID=A0AAD6TPH3_9AGAR|nr:hypothetical protein B0H15DRAFT_154220 [Mycena belliae]